VGLNRRWCCCSVLLLLLLLPLSRGRVRSNARRAQVKVCASAVADLQKKYGKHFRRHHKAAGAVEPAMLCTWCSFQNSFSAGHAAAASILSFPAFKSLDHSIHTFWLRHPVLVEQCL
jgi:hypothetical protein